MAQSRLVSIPIQKLLSGNADLSTEIRNAYGPDGLGVLTVSMESQPDYSVERAKLLHLAQELASLPRHALQALEDSAASYNIGWSHGKEELADGRPDTAKGSFYANILTDDPGTGDDQDAEQYPEYHRRNLWPSAHLPELEPAFKALGKTIYEVGCRLAVHCDRYVEQCHGPEFLHLSQVIQGGRHHKARLLHYFHQPCQDTGTDTSLQASDSVDQDQDQHSQSWCGWHTDHGSLTGLTRAMYLHRDTGREVGCPDADAGLYVRTRKGEVVKVNIPENHIAYQVGEALQVHSGGVLRATPHYVRAPRPCAAPDPITRSTFALFMQPDMPCKMDAPAGVSSDSVAVGAWRSGQTFGQFSKATFKQYYKQQVLVPS